MLQKYAGDQGGYLAAAITYYGFFAIFPLLLVLTTVPGFILEAALTCSGRSRAPLSATSR